VLSPTPIARVQSSAAESRAGSLELVLAHAGMAQVALDASVAALELLEDAGHRGGGRLRDPSQPFELRLALGGGEPGLVPRQQALLAERLVGRDRGVVHSGQPEQEGREQAGSVLAADAVDDDPARRRVRDRPDRPGHVRLEAL